MKKHYPQLKQKPGRKVSKKPSSTSIYDSITMKDYRTLCCNAVPYRTGRASYLCGKCNRQVMLEMTFFFQITDEGREHQKHLDEVTEKIKRND